MSFLSQTRLRCAAAASRVTVSRALTALALVVLLAIIAATTQQLLNLRSAAIADTDRQLQRLDMVFAEQTGRAVETMDVALNSAVEVLQAARRAPPIASLYSDMLLPAEATVGRLEAFTANSSAS